MIDVELLMDQLATRGITVLIKADHERMAERRKPWTMVLSGPALGESGLIRIDAPSLDHCLKYCLRELRGYPGDWAWLEAYSSN
jgi:hypothetical protein